MDRRVVVVFVLCFIGLNSWAQENVTTLGIQFKPMVTSQFFGTGPETGTNGEITVDFEPRFGINFGMVIRKGLTKNWSLETGINLVQRNYRVRYHQEQLPQPHVLSYRFIGYEMPLQAMIYVRLGDNLYMNASGGLSIDFYPTDVETTDSDRLDTLRFDFSQKTYRNHWIQFSVLANYGFEWRTKEKGYFYLGASFHRPFSDIAKSVTSFYLNTNPTRLEYPLSGSYLTVDLRYFFHEDPERKKKKKL